MLHKKSLIWLLTYMVILGGMIYLRDVEGISINKLFFVAVVLVFSITSSYSSLVNQIMFTLPLMYGLPGNYLLLIWVAMILWKKGVANIGIKPFLFAGIILMAEIAHYAFYVYPVDIMWLMTYIASMLLIALLFSERVLPDFSQPILCFCIGSCVLLSILFIMYSVDPFLYEQFGTRMGRKLSDTEELNLATNPNSVAFFSVISAACSFILYYYKKINAYLFYSLFFLSFFLGAYSISRTWVLAFLLFFVLIILFNKRRYSFFLLTIPIIFLIIFFLVKNNLSLVEAFTDRFIGEDIESAGGRTIIFNKYNTFLLNNPIYLFWGTSVQFYKSVSELFFSTHNGTQQICVCYGISGLLFFICVLYSAVKKRYISGQYNSLIPLVLSLFFLQSIQSLDPVNGLYPLIPSMFILSLPELHKY